MGPQFFIVLFRLQDCELFLKIACLFRISIVKSTVLYCGNKCFKYDLICAERQCWSQHSAGAAVRLSWSAVIWSRESGKWRWSYWEFRHVETLFVQGNISVLNQNKPHFLVIKKEVIRGKTSFFIIKKGGLFWSVRRYYLGRIKFLHVEMPYWILLLSVIVF